MMDHKFNFIAGLPRSGSTLLSAIFNQNPLMSAGITGPAATILAQMKQAVSGANESAMFLNDANRHMLLRHAVMDCHLTDRPIVWDTNRSWPNHIQLLAKLFPECKMVCCVRDIAWVVDSIERLVRKNTYELSAIFGFKPHMNMFDRAKHLTEGGLVGSANMAMMEAAYGPERDRLILVEYETLTRYPKETMESLYSWLDMPYYDRHDFNAINQIAGAAEFDRRMGTPGLHDLGPSVKFIERDSVLPPELFNLFGVPFWRTGTAKVKVIHHFMERTPDA